MKSLRAAHNLRYSVLLVSYSNFKHFSKAYEGIYGLAVDMTEFFLDSGGFLKWWYPTTMGFPTKNDHFGVFWGYHHLRKHLHDEDQLAVSLRSLCPRPLKNSPVFPTMRIRKLFFLLGFALDALDVPKKRWKQITCPFCTLVCFP